MKYLSLILANILISSTFELGACCHVDNVTDTTLLVNGQELAPSHRMSVPKGSTVEVTYLDHNSCPCSGTDCDGTCITFPAGCNTISGGKIPSFNNNEWTFESLHHVNWCKW